MNTFKKLICTALVLVMVLCAVSVTAAADDRVIAWGAATVDASALNIRSGPGTDYDRVGVISDGTVVVVIEKTNSDWYLINYLGTKGYVASEYLKNLEKAENFKATGVVNGDSVRMRSGPSTGKKAMASYDKGDSVSIIGINNGWYKIVTSVGTGYMRSDYIDITSGGPTYTTDTRDADSNYSLGQQIANFALQFEGYKYVYGEESPSKGFDCSGLVYYVYGQFGYKMERRASLQCKNNGRYVSRSELQPGDLVFFTQNGSTASHVGIYIGNDHYIHASTAKTGVKISELKEYFCAKRII